MDPLWSETCWSAFKYFIILIVSTNNILCLSWIKKVFNYHWCTVQTWRKSHYYFSVYFCNRIFSFLFVALCLLASLTDLFVCLTHRIAILKTSLTILSTVFWRCSEQPKDPIHQNSAMSWTVTVIISSTEPMWATYAILDSNRVIDPLTVSTSFTG